MKILKITLAALVICVLVSACGSSRRGGKSVVPLRDIEWHLVELNGVAVSSDGYRMVFASDGMVSGVGECNRFSGTFEADGKRLKVDKNIVSTKMMCLRNQDRETAFLKILGKVDKYRIAGSRLLLIVNGDVEAIFEPARGIRL